MARGDEQVGIGAVPGGAEGYAAAVARHTSTTLTPEQIHQIGLDVLADLQQEWAVLGERVLGERRVPEILERLRSDPTLRFDTAGEVLGVVTRAMNRAEAAVPDWFAGIGTLPCVVEEIDPVEAGNAALAYYRPASLEGDRPGAHCVLTADPGSRFRYEYEALAFHESVPGHHLQISSALLLPDLPRYRKHLDAQLCAYIEGWGLYSERLADEMGLYTDDLARLGMLSFDSLRACRLVVDTGMHALGWSRSRAIEFIWSNTATTRANVTNEIDRYIAWPGQALAYMIGRREIGRLRERSSAALGARVRPPRVPSRRAFAGCGAARRAGRDRRPLGAIGDRRRPGLSPVGLSDDRSAATAPPRGPARPPGRGRAGRASPGSGRRGS